MNRCATVTRARDVIYWGTARLLRRLITARKSGPLFLTDRKAKPSAAKTDTDDSTGRARRAATLFEEQTAGMRRGPFTLHSRLAHADADGVERTHLGAQPGEVREGVG